MDVFLQTLERWVYIDPIHGPLYTGSHIHQQFSLYCRSIINFSRQCLDPGIRAKYFSPRLMEVLFCTVICFLHFLDTSLFFSGPSLQIIFACARFFVLYFISLNTVLNFLLILAGCNLVLGQMGCNLFSTT